MVFMDEFLFFDPRALPVILPTLANGAALVLTSSIAPNAADDLMRMLDVRYADGTRVVNVLNWIVSCKACQARGASDRCTHRRQQRPQHFQKAIHQERQKALMSIFAGSYEREMLNVPDKPTRKPAFDHATIEALRGQDRTYAHNQYIPRFFVVIDPNAGSFSSDMVLTSCCYLQLGGLVYLVVRSSFSFLLFFCARADTPMGVPAILRTATRCARARQCRARGGDRRQSRAQSPRSACGSAGRAARPEARDAPRSARESP
jgi:hypothetical protein